MPTIKDIAKLAGVSYGTVSNVLNKKGNVSLEKIKSVEFAANELGYHHNRIASSLRSNKKSDLALIIPSLDDYSLRKIYNLLIKKVSGLDIRLNLYITDYNPIKEEEFFRASIATNKHIIIDTTMTYPDFFYGDMTFKDSNVIFINSNITIKDNNIYKLNFNTNQLINDLKIYINNNTYNNILLFTERDFPTFELDNITNLSCSLPYNLPNAIEVLSENDFDLIIVSSIEKYESIILARKILQATSNIKLILISDQDAAFEILALKYYQDFNLLVENIFEIISTTKSISNTIDIAYDGFEDLNINDHFNDNKYINILLIESPSTSALIKIKPYLEKKLGFKINVDIIKYNEYNLLDDEKFINNYDLIRIDMAYLPNVAKKIFKPLDQRFEMFLDYFIDDLFEYTHYDDILYALPFDISAMVLMYRSDILNNQLIQREYYEQTKKNNIIPQNYDEYNTLESFIKLNYGDIFKPSTVCFGSSITCGNEFIIRVKHSNILDTSGNLNFEDKHVKAALKSYAKSVSYSENFTNTFWDDVIKQYSDGSTSMSLVYSNYIHTLKTFNREILYKTKYTSPPTNKSLIGGGIFGLIKSTNKDNLAYLFLKLLYSDQIGKLLTHLGATMPIKSIYNDINLISMYPWLNLIPNIIKNNTRKYYRDNNLIYETIEYEKKIGREVKKYLTNNKL